MTPQRHQHQRRVGHPPLLQQPPQQLLNACTQPVIPSSYPQTAAAPTMQHHFLQGSVAVSGKCDVGCDEMEMSVFGSVESGLGT